MRIPMDLMAELESKLWMSADYAARRAIAQRISQIAGAAGHILSVGDGSDTFPHLLDSHGRVYVVVPKGTLLPGLPKSKCGLLFELFDEHAVEPLVPYMCDAPWDYGSLLASVDDLGVPVGPFLIERSPGEIAGDAALPSDSIPTSLELEWAVRGPTDTLFPWGDHLPRWLREYASHTSFTSLVEAAEACGQDPAIARGQFGILDPVTRPVWCEPGSSGDAEIDREFPHAFRGGASQCAPWQGCNEWLLWLTTCEVRQTPGCYREHCLRRITRLSTT